MSTLAGGVLLGFLLFLAWIMWIDDDWRKR